MGNGKELTEKYMHPFSPVMTLIMFQYSEEVKLMGRVKLGGRHII